MTSNLDQRAQDLVSELLEIEPFLQSRFCAYQSYHPRYTLRARLLPEVVLKYHFAAERKHLAVKPFLYSKPPLLTDGLLERSQRRKNNKIDNSEYGTALSMIFLYFSLALCLSMSARFSLCSVNLVILVGGASMTKRI